jgi:hypothetical protein
VGAENFASIITAIVTILAERKLRTTLEHFNRHCNYLLYYGIQAAWNFNISEYSLYEHQKISDIRNPGLYSWAVGIKECSSDNKFRNKRCPLNMRWKYIVRDIQSHLELATAKPCEKGKVTSSCCLFMYHKCWFNRTIRNEKRYDSFSIEHHPHSTTLQCLLTITSTRKYASSRQVQLSCMPFLRVVMQGPLS